MITTRGLTKHYGRITAVDAVDLNVSEGARYGLLGPNGSGKTTLVRMLLGLVFATRGEIEVMGRPVPRKVTEVLPEIGAMVEGPAAYRHLSGRANLTLLDASGPGSARRRRAGRVDEALERVGLGGVDERPVKAYSLGMRQRLGLAAALMNRPRLLVLDEPTNGLDPQGIREVRDLLAELSDSGTTIFLCSHLLGEVEQLCSSVGVMDRGRLVLEEDMEALRAPTGRILVSSPDADQVVGMLDGRVESREGERLVVRGEDAAELNARLVRAGLRVSELHPERRTLEQVVLEATGPSADRVDGTAGTGRRRFSWSRPDEDGPASEPPRTFGSAELLTGSSAGEAHRGNGAARSASREEWGPPEPAPLDDERPLDEQGAGEER